MRHKLINVEGDNLYGGSVVYSDDDVEAARYLNHYKASDDGIGYYHHPGVRSSFYIAEIHQLFNASTAGDLSFNKGRGFFVISDIALNQLSSYLNK